MQCRFLTAFVMGRVTWNAIVRCERMVGGEVIWWHLNAVELIVLAINGVELLFWLAVRHVRHSIGVKVDNRIATFRHMPQIGVLYLSIVGDSGLTRCPERLQKSEE